MAAGSVRVVSRYTTFALVADPTAERARVLVRHAGAARFAFNQGLRLHLDARDASRNAATAAVADDGALVKVPWTGFDLINAFNAWKRSEDAGRRIVIDSEGVAEFEVTGLAWRSEVCAQVFEEAVVDLGKALGAWTESRRDIRAGRAVGLRTACVFLSVDLLCSGYEAVRLGAGAGCSLSDCVEVGAGVEDACPGG